MNTLNRMSNNSTQIVAGIGGFLSAIFLKMPLDIIDSDKHRLFIALIGGAISAIVGWFIKLILDRAKARYEDRKRKNNWRKKLDE